MKRKPRQLEISWDKPEALALVTEQTGDGDRVEAERRQRQTDVAESAKHQLTMLGHSEA